MHWTDARSSVRYRLVARLGILLRVAGTAEVGVVVTGMYTGHVEPCRKHADRLLVARDLAGCIAQLDYLGQEHDFTPTLEVYEVSCP